VITPQQLRDCEKLKLAFAVSPGSTGKLLGAAEDYNVPLLPGGVTASECMALLEWGYTIQKFFPAEPAGGSAYLASLASPLPQISFCPTGGITPELAPKYLKLSNVITIGGSWMAPKALVSAGNWAEIERLAREASKLKG
jgi:2-dehydro-3-deoxyphosphogluconate aldolase/(4S)-4-hydroxy-2-oxoglutarate aldolase